MFFIIAHHYAVHSGMIRADGSCISWYEISFHNLFVLIFGMWGKTAINGFVLITGYFMCTSRIRLRKFLKLFLQIEFYNLLIAFLFFAFHHEGFSVSDLFLNLLPVRSITNNFTGCYLLFWLTIPFLNVLIHGIDRKNHLCLICLCVFIYTIMLYIPDYHVSMNYVSWFIVLYLISSYIRLYPEAVYKNQSVGFWLGATFLSAFVSVLSVCYALYHNNNNFDQMIPVYWLVSDSNAILALLVAVTSFMLFKNIRVPYLKYVNLIGATTFGVYLIHDNCDVMRHWLWNNIIDTIGRNCSMSYFLYVPLAILCVFVVFSAIDNLRIQTFEKWLFRYLDGKVFLPCFEDKTNGGGVV